MAVDPNDITTVRVGQLPVEPFNLSDVLPHEVGSDLKSGTVQSMADVIGAYLGVIGGIGFRPETTPDGGILPTTSTEEWMLVGAGTFTNVGGGPNITTTEELNALISNGTYWFIGVEIPINVELAGITQVIRSGFTNTTPSEDAVFNALALKANVSDLSNAVGMTDYPRLLVATQNFNIPVGKTAKWAQVNQATWYPLTSNNAAEPFTFTQSGSTVTFKTIRPINNYIVIFYV